MKVELRTVALLVLLGLAFLTPAKAVSPDTEVRAAVLQVFQQLKTRNFDALYDSLPSGSRSRIPRDRFTNALRRSQDMYALERIEIGRTRVSGDLALVDTTLYGRVLKPFDTEGKIVVQQYLVREKGKWKVATGDNSTIRRFLETNPAFGRQFRISSPHVYIKKDGNWIEFSPPRRVTT